MLLLAIFLPPGGLHLVTKTCPFSVFCANFHWIGVIWSIFPSLIVEPRNHTVHRLTDNTHIYWPFSETEIEVGHMPKIFENRDKLWEDLREPFIKFFFSNFFYLFLKKILIMVKKNSSVCVYLKYIPASLATSLLKCVRKSWSSCFDGKRVMIWGSM